MTRTAQRDHSIAVVGCDQGANSRASFVGISQGGGRRQH